MSKGLRFIKLSEASSPTSKHLIRGLGMGWWVVRGGRGKYRRRWQVSLLRDSFTGAAGLKGTGPWEMQTPLFRTAQMQLISRHRIFRIALIPDVGMCFANDVYISFSQ